MSGDTEGAARPTATASKKGERGTGHVAPGSGRTRQFLQVSPFPVSAGAQWHAPRTLTCPAPGTVGVRQRPGEKSVARRTAVTAGRLRQSARDRRRQAATRARVRTRAAADGGIPDLWPRGVVVAVHHLCAACVAALEIRHARPGAQGARCRVEIPQRGAVACRSRLPPRASWVSPRWQRGSRWRTRARTASLLRLAPVVATMTGSSTTCAGR